MSEKDAPKVNEEQKGAEALKRALVAVRDLRSRLDGLERARTEPIAIVGMACRLPGQAAAPEAFWQLLREGREAVGEVPPERWAADEFFDSNPEAPGKTYARTAAFVEGVDLFDPAFFGISPREALSLDPQQRLLLEVSFEALERAGQAPEELRGSDTGVFVGISTNDYAQLVRGLGGDHIDPYTGTGGAFCVAAGRISYTLGLHGPNLAVDTACSSALVALQLAVQSLRSGACRMALAGGVNLMLAPEATVYLSKVRALSATGHCRTFAAGADGYVRGEGCGVVVLKRLSDALSHGDHVLAVIRGAAVNHDGKSGGLTVPNAAAQQAVLRLALADAGVSAADVSYVEAHGTGTPLGDPIEVRALMAVLGEGRSRERPLVLGSAKTNIGHLEAAAGIAGLIKVVLSLQHGEIPAHLHFENPSPHIAWDELPVTVPTKLRGWPEGRKIAGVSSFGFSGTNAHVILEEAPKVAGRELPGVERPLHVLSLSAMNEEALLELAGRYCAYLRGAEAAPLGDVCFTANVGRSHFAHRLAVVGGTAVEVAAKLQSVETGQESPGVFRGVLSGRGGPKVAFLFTGQGSQYAGMGRGLYETQPTFRKALDLCAEILKGRLEKPLLDVVFGAEGSEGLIDRTAYTQPSLFALEWALSEMWRSWGVEPGAVLGHSVGEYVAAAVSGVLTLEDALGLIAERGRLMEALPAGGAMVAVTASEEKVEAAILTVKDVSIAAVNGPSSVVMSGAAAAVKQVSEALRKDGIKSQELVVSHAFHSALLDPMLGALESAASKVEHKTPRMVFLSNLTGRALKEGDLSPEYWRRHARETVRFADSMRVLEEKGYEVFVEMGPNPVLLGMGRRCVKEGFGSWTPSLRKGKEDWGQILGSVASLYVSGVSVDGAGFDRDYPRRRVVLPTYPFQRQRYWIDLASRRRPAAVAEALHPLLGSRVPTPLREQLFTVSLGLEGLPFLKDHAFLGRAVYPAAAYVEMALAAADAAGLGPVSVADLVIEAPLVFEPGEDRRVQSIVRPAEAKESAFEVFGREGVEEGAWTRHVTCRLLPQTEAAPQTQSLADLQVRCAESRAVGELYDGFRASGVEYGPAFQGIESLWRGEGCALGRVRVPDAALAGADAYRIHPALLDAAFQLLGAVLPEDGGESLYLPTGLTGLWVVAAVPERLWAFASLDASDPARLSADLCLFDDAGRVAVRVDRLVLQRTSREAVARSSTRSLRDWFYEVRWPADDRPAGHALPAVGTWVVMMDGTGLGASVTARLEEGGSRVVRVFSGEAFAHHTDGSVTVRPTHAPDFESLLALARSDRAKPIQGLVSLWGHDDAIGAHDPEESPSEAMARSLAGVLHLAQAAVRAGGDPKHLWIVTRGAQAIEGDGSAVRATATALWGLGRTIAAEHPEVGAVCVDLDPAPTGDGVLDLLRELGEAGDENQVAYRQGTRRRARLARATAPSVAEVREAPPGQSLQLQIEERGVLDNLRRVAVPRRAPGCGEVEVQVRAAGLNFRDVLNALGMYAGEAGLLGNELAGTVVAIGEGVDTLTPGDSVMGMGEGCFGDYVTTPALQLVRAPGRLSFEEAATVPVAFLTAHYALRHLAHLSAGERVLIHSGAGGVGMAAIQIARRAGAEIFATAGSPRKRELLASLGVSHVMDSRSTKFADEIRERTGGTGIDVVLNSLTGEAIPSSLGLLRKGGRFLEIGKAGIWEPERVAAAYPHAAYHVIFLGALTVEDPALVQAMLSELGRSLEDGALQPLPLQVFPMREAADAFRHMAAARHVGKVVLGVGAGSKRGAVRSDGTYLVTGGLGGLGLRTARWLVDKGARNLVLVGRSAPSSAARDAVKEMEVAGARVTVQQADVSRPADVTRLLAEIARDTPPLRGVIHAAGVLDDGALLRTTWERILPVLAAKAEGASNLDRATRDLPLDFFVMYSSVASVFGAPGQAGYAAANAFLDGLAHRRVGEGRPGLSVNWGPWAEVGMAAAQDEAAQRRRAQGGADAIAPTDGLRALEELLDRGVTQAAVFPVRWGAFLRGREAPPFLRDVAKDAAGAGKPTAAGRGPELLRQIAEASESERADLLLAHVRQQALKVLGLASGNTLSPDQPLSDLGLDSLMAVELRNALGAALGTPLPPTLLFDYPTVNALAGFLTDKIPAMRRAAAVPGPAKEERERDALVAEIKQLSESEVEAAIARELGSLG